MWAFSCPQFLSFLCLQSLQSFHEALLAQNICSEIEVTKGALLHKCSSWSFASWAQNLALQGDSILSLRLVTKVVPKKNSLVSKSKSPSWEWILWQIPFQLVNWFLRCGLWSRWKGAETWFSCSLRIFLYFSRDTIDTDIFHVLRDILLSALDSTIYDQTWEKRVNSVNSAKAHRTLLAVFREELLSFALHSTCWSCPWMDEKALCFAKCARDIKGQTCHSSAAHTTNKSNYLWP